MGGGGCSQKVPGNSIMRHFSKSIRGELYVHRSVYAQKTSIFYKGPSVRCFGYYIWPCIENKWPVCPNLTHGRSIGEKNKKKTGLMKTRQSEELGRLLLIVAGSLSFSRNRHLKCVIYVATVATTERFIETKC